MKVVNDKIADLSGNVLQLRGVNRAGLEYACSQMDQFISDPYSAGAGGVNTGKTLAYADVVAASFLKWDAPNKTQHAINTVRLPLNEECWLGINGANPLYSGTNYQTFVKRLVNDLTSQKMYVVLDLHWSAPGTWLPGKDGSAVANGQNLAPNADHSILFWQQVAGAYKSYPNVLFDLFNEPGISCHSCGLTDYAQQDNWAWNLYRDGGTYTYSATDGDMYASRAGQTWKVAGTQQLTNTIRATGATNPIIIETLGYGNGYIDMAGSHMPSDPLKSVIFSFHAYDFSGYNAGTAGGIQNVDAALKTGLDVNYNQVQNITGRFPFYLGEYGTTGSCPSGVNAAFVTSTMGWLDSHNYAGTAWSWDSGEGCWGPSLVGPAVGTADDTGTTTPYGEVVKQHLQSQQV